MRFPKQELNIDEYLRKISSMLADSTCHIFIDTNIISQLYRLNESARNDFYKWINICKDRFHIPNWSVQEYSQRVTNQTTKEYLSELSKAKTLSKELNNISKFIKAYVGASLLVGTMYEDKKDDLFQDMETITKSFEKIANAINKNLKKHQMDVHKEIIEKLECFTLDTDIYKIIDNLCFGYELRLGNCIPPGFKDARESFNNVGDLIIWKEILSFCENKKPKDAETEKAIKAVLVTRDLKPDLVYTPQKQITSNGIVIKEEDKIEIAQESLIYEFSLAAGTEDFQIISFYTLVKCLASNYQELAYSFQVELENERESILDASPVSGISNANRPHNENREAYSKKDDNGTYSPIALKDREYVSSSNPELAMCIDDLRSHNWYKQNFAIGRLSKFSPEQEKVTQERKDDLFVLGRNVLQSAEGQAYRADDFLHSLKEKIRNWPKELQQSFVDGCLYEMFYDSSGNERAEDSRKIKYKETIINQLPDMGLTTVFLSKMLGQDVT